MHTKHTKKLICTTAVALACCCMSACSSNEKIAFHHFWKENVLATQYSLTETLVYDVTFSASTLSSNRNYTLDYKDGVYTTSLTLHKNEDGQSFYYVYRTELSINAVYTLQGETKTCEDSIVSEIQFKDDSTLTPIRSTKTIKSSSPVNAEVSSLENCYSAYEYTIHTEYNDAGSHGATTITNKENESETEEFDIDTSKYCYLDNEQLLLAVRGIDPTVNSGANVQVYAPFTKKTQTIGIQFSSIVSADFSFQQNGEAVTKTAKYYPVSVKIGGNYPGATQTVWVASQKTSAFRNVLLKLETPLSYDLGTLTYTLRSAEFSN